MECWLREDGRSVAAVLAVLDGHGGADAAELAAEMIPSLLLTLLAEGMSLRDALDEVFGCLERELVKRISHPGTCANLCLLAGSYIWCANLGDCRACYVDLDVLSLTWLSKDHDASSPSEKARIEMVGGYVQNGRVGGALEPSRTLGDLDVKRLMPGAVLAEPEHRLLDLRELHLDTACRARGVMITASDGLWKCVDSRGVLQIVESRIKILKHGEPASLTALDNLTQALVDRGDPMDDVTVLTALVDVTWLSNDIHDSYTGAGGVPRPCLEAVTVGPCGEHELRPDDGLLNMMGRREDTHDPVAGVVTVMPQ